MSADEERIKNPYLHLSKKQLLRRFKRVERNLMKIMDGKGAKLDQNLNRVALLTISEALHDKEQTEMLNNIFQMSSSETKTEASTHSGGIT